MATPTSPTMRRSNTSSTDDDSTLPEDTSEVTKLFYERLQAWKHACGYLEDYVKTTEKMQHTHGKEYEKVLKTINSPLKEGEHFDHNTGGISSLFDGLRQNTQAISNSHTQTAQTLKGSVLPTFERLHTEIKNRQKELNKGAGKTSKAVDKARNDTQKHVEQLGTKTASYHALTAKDAEHDPYILQRGVNHRLNKQFQEENSNRQELLSVQSNFSQFEAHIVQMFQQGLGQFNAAVGGQADQQKQLYAFTTQTAQAVDPMHEWNVFVRRNNNVLIDPNTPARTLSNATFPNQNHESTKPMCQGSLERKSGMLRKFDTNMYVVTPSRFLHEFKTDDDLNKDPSPDLSLFLPDCNIGALNGNLFTIKGKDVSKGKLGATVAVSKEYEFRAASGQTAETWYNVIMHLCGKRPNEAMSPTSPTGSLASREKQQQSEGPTSPTSAQETGVAQPALTTGYGGTAPHGAAAQDMVISSPTSSGGVGSGAPTGALPDGTGVTKTV